MSSLDFYHSPQSTSNATEHIFAELDIPHNVILVDRNAKDQKSPSYLAMNPNGLVPLIVHNGVPIWESSAIAMYLGETFGVEKNLYPPLGPKRGQAMQWIVWCNATLTPSLRPAFYAVLSGNPDTEVAKESRKKTREYLEALQKGLEGKEYLLGEYTLVDTHVNSFVMFCERTGIDMTGLEGVSAYIKRVSSRPQLAKLLAQ